MPCKPVTRTQPDSQESYDPFPKWKRNSRSNNSQKTQQSVATRVYMKRKAATDDTTEPKTKPPPKRRRRTFKEIEHEDLKADRPLDTIPKPPLTHPMSDRTFHSFLRLCPELQMKILRYAATPEHFVATIWAAGNAEAATLHYYHENYEDGDYSEIPSSGPMKLRWDWIFDLF